MVELLHRFAEWLRTTPVVDLARWLSDTPSSRWIVTRFWAIPILQVVHILAIAGSFAAVLMIALAVHGRAGHAAPAEIVRRYTRWLWASLAVQLLSGAAMVVGEPMLELTNPIFWIKMALVACAILVALRFTGGLRRALAGGGAVGGGARATAGLLVLLWCAIMFAGRWIAYAPA